MICNDASMEEVQRQFALTARYVCDQVETFQPDLVIGLAHSGWLPVELAQGLWVQTRSLPFPPTVRTNFGREKTEIFERWRYQGAERNHFYNSSDCAEECEQALSWLKTQHSWQVELKAHIQTSCPNLGIPSRVLVVDDFVAGGLTSLLFLGLLATLYPKADSRLIDMDLDGWKERLAALWLERFHPEVLAKIELAAKNEVGKDSQETLYFRSMQPITKIAAGTEDIQPDSLQWQRIGPDSPCLRVQPDLLPAHTWLELIAWVGSVREESIHTALEMAKAKIGGDQTLYQARGAIQFFLTGTHPAYLQEDNEADL